jgi:hypothetical protein
VLAAGQRPITPAAFAETSKTAAWKTIPSWALIPTQDRAIGAANERFMAKRAGSHTVEVNDPHGVYLTNPGAVTDIILRAARAQSSSSTQPSLARTGLPEHTVVLGSAAGLTLAAGATVVAFSRRSRALNR